MTGNQDEGQGAGGSGEQKEAVKFEIQVDRQHFTWEQQFITGRDVLKLVGLDDGKHGVAILRGGSEQDIPVGLDQSVDLSDPKNRRFKTFPDKSTEGA